MSEDWLKKTLDAKLGFILGPFPGRFHASSLGDGARLLMLKYQGLIVEEIDAKKARRFGAGTAVHNRWEEDLRKAGVLVASEQDIAKNAFLPITGRLDFVVLRTVEEAPVLVELKTKDDFGWRKVKAPEYSALCQWAYYSHMEEIKDGYIIYENLNTQESHFFQVLRDGDDVYTFYKKLLIGEWPGLVKKILNKVAYALYCAEHNLMPEKCEACVLQRCWHPKDCGEAGNGKTIFTVEEWERNVRNVRQDS